MYLSTLFGVSLIGASLPLAAWAVPGGHSSGSNGDASSTSSSSPAESSSSGGGSGEGQFKDARLTYYSPSVGLGACGKQNDDQSFTVALNEAQYGSGYPGPHCFQEITIYYNGKSADATIMDMCPGCPYGGLDLSPGLFQHFDSLDKGVLTASWSFKDGSGSSSGSSASGSSSTSGHNSQGPSSTGSGSHGSGSSTSATGSSGSGPSHTTSAGSTPSDGCCTCGE